MANRNRSRDLYTDQASLYERLFVHLLGWGKELEAFFRESGLLHPTMRVLDAGCGTGIITRVLYQLALENRGTGIEFHAFDLTPKMLEIFATWIERQGADAIEVRRADVLEMEVLPPHWRDYDLIVASTLLEYLPRDRVEEALAQLRQRLAQGGRLVVLVTRHTAVTEWLASRWWQTHLFTDLEMEIRLRAAGFTRIVPTSLPGRWSDYITVIEAKA